MIAYFEPVSKHCVCGVWNRSKPHTHLIFTCIWRFCPMSHLFLTLETDFMQNVLKVKFQKMTYHVFLMLLSLNFLSLCFNRVYQQTMCSCIRPWNKIYKQNIMNLWASCTSYVVIFHDSTYPNSEDQQNSSLVPNFQSFLILRNLQFSVLYFVYATMLDFPNVNIEFVQNDQWLLIVTIQMNLQENTSMQTLCTCWTQQV